MARDLSVILCTHHPRKDALARTLAALAAQDLPLSKWQLLVIDNATSPPLDGHIDLSWHSDARVIREDVLGLTAARLRGIRESTGSILCFVDDDNELDVRYLSAALKIAERNPQLGCWGGEILGEYEVKPPSWIAPYLGMLAVRPLGRDRWGNAYQCDDAMPCGAGLCLRRAVAERYAHACETSTLRKSLDRRGGSLASNGDIDMAYTAIDMGLGSGRFKSLRLTHLIPSSRLQAAYLAKLAEAMAESNLHLDACREETAPRLPRIIPLTERIALALQWLKAGPNERRMIVATRRGLAKACRELETGDQRSEVRDQKSEIR